VIKARIKVMEKMERGIPEPGGFLTMFFSFFLVVLEFKFRTLHFLGK
jgi:hypothetical protein